MSSGDKTSEKVAVSVVIPVYNGEHTVARLGENLIDVLGRIYRLEIILVNDCSQDNSEAVCESFFHRHPLIVRFYSLAKNVGEHNAVMAGLNHATGDYAVIMDDDFQNPVSGVVKLLDHAIKNDCDVTYSYYKKKKHSFLRNLGSFINDKVANIMIKKPKDLYLSSFKVLNRFLVNEIIKYELPYPYIDGLILRTTDKIAKVEVEHEKSQSAKSGYTLTKLIRLWLNMFTNFSILPLRVSIIFGFLISLLGLIFGVVIILEKFSNPDMPLGYTSIIVAVLLFAGIQLISAGIIGEYIGRIFLSQNKKPQYSIRKSLEPGSSGNGSLNEKNAAISDQKENSWVE
jgi:glycosyltransferase involved in cell wall biosynthesis